MNARTRKLDGLEDLRGIAALIVLLHHAAGSIELPQNYDTRVFWGVFIEGTLGVNIFFVLSGFVIAYSNQKDGRSFREILIYILRRLARIFPAYWVVCLAALPLYWKFAPASIGEVTVSRILHDLLLIPYDKPPMLGVAWTLVFEITFYLLFIPILIHRRAGFMLWSALVLAILALNGGDVRFSNPWAALLSSPLMLQFVAGMAVCWWTLKHPLSARSARATLWTGAVLLFLFAVGECITGTDWVSNSHHYAVCAAIMIYGVVNLPPRESSVRGPGGRFLQVLGRYSFSIYLIHVPIQKILVKLALKVTGPEPGIIVILMVTLLLIAGSLTAGILLGKFFEIPFLGWCKTRIAKLKPHRPEPTSPAPPAPA